MGSCSGQFEEISAFLDGELTGDQELELRRHLDECESCAAWRVQLEAFSAGVARSLGQERAPHSLSERVQGLAPRFWRRSLAVAVLTPVLGALAVFALWSARPADSFEAALLEDHHRLISGGTALDVASTNPIVVANALGERLPFRIEVAHVPEARLRGGHACHMQGRHAAYLQYERGGERVSVFVYRSSGPSAKHGWRCRPLGGESLCEFEDSEQTVAVVASTPRMARAFQGAVRVVSTP